MDGKLLMSNERIKYLNNIIKGNVDNFIEIDTQMLMIMTIIQKLNHFVMMNPV